MPMAQGVRESRQPAPRLWLAGLLIGGLLASCRPGVPPSQGSPSLTGAERFEAPIPPTGSSLPAIRLSTNAAGAWQFTVNNAEFPLRGVGGADVPGLLEKLKAAGGNCVRTWGVETLETPVSDGARFIDRAHQLGLMVIPGIWVEHERHGADYADPEFLGRQRTRVVEAVRKYKGHPAVLAWGLGNEMEGPLSPTGSVQVLREVEVLARLVKQEDPRHPVMTVIAYSPAKVANLKECCPSIDILGINSYGGASGAGLGLKAAGWTKPFAVTEFGVRGFWEVGTTSWGAPWEPTSHEKARTYFATHTLVCNENDGKELCLGTFAFLWGWKQEKTATWFGMFLPTLEKLPQVDAMTRAWTGKWPANRCPIIRALSSGAAGRVVKPGLSFIARANAEDPEGDTLSCEWSVVPESGEASVGGDVEKAPLPLGGSIRKQAALECEFTSPAAPGNYRVFLVIRDNKGSAATANFPFQVVP